jgi:hypothetical protein
MAKGRDFFWDEIKKNETFIDIFPSFQLEVNKEYGYCNYESIIGHKLFFKTFFHHNLNLRQGITFL